MTCAVRCTSRQLSRTGLARLRTTSADRLASAGPPPVDARFEVSGTWDFKWRRGSRIRVAFQRLPQRMEAFFDAFLTVKTLVIELAQRWETSVPGMPRFDFSLPDLDPPLGDGAAPADRHRSSFSKTTTREAPYDILVSLQDLPIALEDPFRAPDDQRQALVLPVAELGSYARRGDYGAPTMYIGRFGKFALSQKPDDFVGFYGQGIGQHVVVHEFGHAVRLPHLHQHPRLIESSNVDFHSAFPHSAQARRQRIDAARASFYRPVSELEALFEALLGVEVPDAVVREQLIEGWRGNEAFSDWLGPDAETQSAHARAGTLDSVMTFPYYACMKRGHEPCEHCGPAAKSFPFVTMPRPLDIAMLRRMYDPSFELPASVRTAAQ